MFSIGNLESSKSSRISVDRVVHSLILSLFILLPPNLGDLVFDLLLEDFNQALVLIDNLEFF